MSKATRGSAYLDWDVSYGYDLLGRLTSAFGDGWAGTTFAYDALGRMVAEQNYNATTYHAYDLAGRRTRLTWSDGLYVDYRALPGRERGQDVGRAKAASRPNSGHSARHRTIPKSVVRSGDA